MLIVWIKQAQLQRYFRLCYLGSCNGDEHNGDKEIPDEEVDREEELAGPKDLADGHVHIHSLARVDVCF